MGVSARTLAVAFTLAGLIALTGCTNSGQSSWRSPGDGQGGGSSAPQAPALIAAPADGETGVSTAGELSLTGPAAASARVTLTDADGASVEGAMRPDGSGWVPATQLRYSTSYTAAVTADGQSEPRKITFTTMAKPGKTVSVNTALSDGKVYGVGIPIVVRFGSSVPADKRAGVEKRLLVTSEPAQLGAWHWFSGGEVHYRPKEYWQAGTKLTIRLATGGVAMTSDGYGAKDVNLRVSVGEKITMVIDDATKHMTVTKNDQVLKTIPVSLGKASTPSSSGQMVVMDKNQSEVFVSDNPSDPYRQTVYWTQRITTGGEYIHAAPWSVDSQGRRNVSHGCTNVSTDHAKFLYGLTQIGDPVTVTGTSRKLDWGNGWTDWDRSWEEYLKGSALPPPTPSTTTEPSTSASASPGR